MICMINMILTSGRKWDLFNCFTNCQIMMKCRGKLSKGFVLGSSFAGMSVSARDEECFGGEILNHAKSRGNKFEE